MYSWFTHAHAVISLECWHTHSIQVEPWAILNYPEPKLSELSQKCKVATNKHGGKWQHVTSSSASSSEPKAVTVQQRVKQFPNEELVVSSKMLFCWACREEVSFKCSSVKNHIKSDKHHSGKERLAGKEALNKTLPKHNDETHLKGETLPEQQQVFRMKVVTAFLSVAIPLNQLGICLKREPTGSRIDVVRQILFHSC